MEHIPLTAPVELREKRTASRTLRPTWGLQENSVAVSGWTEWRVGEIGPEQRCFLEEPASSYPDTKGTEAASPSALSTNRAQTRR